MFYLNNLTNVSGVVANNGFLYVVGGDDGSSNLGSVEVYNPKLDTWTLLPCAMMTGRSYAGVAIIDKPLWQREEADPEGQSEI